MGPTEATDDDRSIYLVPTEFIQQWRRYQRLPAAVAPPAELPSGLEATGVLCIHKCVSLATSFAVNLNAKWICFQFPDGAICVGPHSRFCLLGMALFTAL